MPFDEGPIQLPYQTKNITLNNKKAFQITPTQNWLIKQKYIIFQITQTQNSVVKLQVTLKIQLVHRIIFHSIYIAAK